VSIRWKGREGYKRSCPNPQSASAFQILQFLKNFCSCLLWAFLQHLVSEGKVHKHTGYDRFAGFCLRVVIYCAGHRPYYRPATLAVWTGTRSHNAPTWIHLWTCVGKPVIRDIIQSAVNHEQCSWFTVSQLSISSNQKHVYRNLGISDENNSISDWIY
jgi:hypothetical protein